MANNGSYTFNKSRYNDDFYLKFNDENIIYYEHSLLEITNSQDWTIGFNVFLTLGGAEQILMYPNGKQVSTGDSNFSVRLNNGGGGVSIILSQVCQGVDFGFKSYTYTKIIPTTTPQLVNIVLAHNTLNNTLTLYFNSEKAHVFTSFDEGDYTNNRLGMTLGGVINNVAKVKEGLRDFFTLSVEMNQSQVNYFYKTGLINTNLDDFLEFHTPLNDLTTSKNEYYVKTSVADSQSWNGGVLFLDKLSNSTDGYLEFQYVDTQSNQAFMVGFTDSTSPMSDWSFTNMKYGVYIIRNAFGINQYRYVVNGGIVATAIIPIPTDVLKIERVGSTITGYVNTTQIFTTTGVTTELSPLILSYFSNVENAKNIKLNGVLIEERDDESKEPTFRAMPSILPKSINLKGQSGLKLGWTDDEIGISNPSQIGAFKDFYTKNQYYGVGVSLQNNKTSIFHRGFVPNLTTTYTNFTFVIKFYDDIKGSASGRWDAWIGNNTTFTNYMYLLPTNMVYIGQNVYSPANRKKVVTLVVSVTPSSITSYLDGRLHKTITGITTQPLTSGANGRINKVTDSRKCGGLYYTSLFNGNLTEQEISEKSKNEDWLSLNPIYFYSSESNGTHYIDQSGNTGDALIDAFPIGSYYENIKYVDKTSKPLIKYGLSFNGTTQYLEVENFNPTKEKGYTIITATEGLVKTDGQQTIFNKVDITNVNNFYGIGKLNNSDFLYTSYPINSTSRSGGGRATSDISNINFMYCKVTDGRNVRVPYLTSGFSTVRSNESLNGDNPIVSDNLDRGLRGFNEITTGVTEIGSRNGGLNKLNGNILYMVVYKGILNDAEVKELYNNGLFANPLDISPITQSDLVLCVDFNNPFDDGGTLKFPDLSPSNHTIIANGYTDLTTLQNARVDINSLR